MYFSKVYFWAPFHPKTSKGDPPRNLQSKVQKQPHKGVPKKRCSENMQQFYRRTPMPKCDFNKVVKQL